MTREEIIKEAAAEHRDCVCCGFYDPIADDKESSFIAGAEWADETMIDKVCKLIEENIDYACLHLGNYMEKEVNAKELSDWIRKVLEE